MKKTIDIPKGYKQSPVGVIPEDWEVKRLGDVCTHFKSGITITSKHIQSIGQYPVYGGNGLRGYTDTYTHDGEYILIGRQGALCGNVSYITGKNYISEHAIAVQTDNNMLWLRYKLDYWNLNRYSESSAQPGLSVEKLIRFNLSVPPLLEQQKIAEILSTWDKAIELQTSIIDKLTLRKRGLMQQLLTGKKRLKGFGGGTFRRLGNYIYEYNERNNNGCKRVLSVTNTKGFVLQKEQFEKTVASNDTSNYKVVHKGDFAYNPSRVNVGSLDMLNEYDEGILSPMYIVFKADENIDKNYLMQCLQSYWFRGHIPAYTQGSVRDSLSFDGLCSMKFYFPSLEEQKVISSILDHVDMEIEMASNKLSSLQAQKKGLMQVLLTGKKQIIKTIQIL